MSLWPFMMTLTLMINASMQDKVSHETLGEEEQPAIQNEERKCFVCYSCSRVETSQSLLCPEGLNQCMVKNSRFISIVESCLLVIHKGYKSLNLWLLWGMHCVSFVKKNFSSSQLSIVGKGRKAMKLLIYACKRKKARSFHFSSLSPKMDEEFSFQKILKMHHSYSSSHAHKTSFFNLMRFQDKYRSSERGEQKIKMKAWFHQTKSRRVILQPSTTAFGLQGSLSH